MLFSATMPGDIIALARRFMNQPIHIRTQDNEDEGAVVSRIKAARSARHALDKIEMLARILASRWTGTNDCLLPHQTHLSENFR
jgi:superfamily II DNA/RNA helicase